MAIASNQKRKMLKCLLSIASATHFDLWFIYTDFMNV